MSEFDISSNAMIAQIQKKYLAFCSQKKDYHRYQCLHTQYNQTHFFENV